MLIKWLLINPHLIPSFVLFIMGCIFLTLSTIIYSIRRKKILILNPVKAIKEYSRVEIMMLIIGIVLGTCGFVSLIIISEMFGYYYFKNGVPTLMKR